MAAINTARAHAGHMHGRRRGTLPQTPTAISGLLVVDLDASALTAHSEKESAAPTYSGGSGFIRCVRSLITVPAALASRWR